MSLGHQGDITKIVVTASDGRFEVVDGYEEGLNVARRWRASWAARPATDPRLPIPADLAARPLTSFGDPRGTRPSGRHPTVTVGGFGFSGLSSQRGTLPGESPVLPEEEHTSPGERRPPRPSLTPRSRHLGSPSSPSVPLPPLAPLSPATLLPPLSPVTLSPVTLAPPRPAPLTPRPGPVSRPRLPLPSRSSRESRESGPPPSEPLPGRATPAPPPEGDGSPLTVLREFGGRNAVPPRRPALGARAVPGAAREPLFSRPPRPETPSTDSAETKGQGPDEGASATQDLIPPRLPQRR